VNESSGRRLILVVDGLGHGAAAAAAAREAQRVFREYCTSDPGEILDRTHGALRSTRGAAVAVAEIREDARELRYAGVGNIAAAAIAPNGVSQHLVSHNGTVGHVVRKIQEFTYPFAPGSLLVMHSDGLGTRWRLDPYPGIAARHPGLVAGVLYRDHKRGRDDVTVLATRTAGGLSS
jgi:serine phosphatase RsbU (regulator of sigma subunit)